MPVVSGFSAIARETLGGGKGGMQRQGSISLHDYLGLHVLLWVRGARRASA
jgi:hypothetical protein